MKIKLDENLGGRIAALFAKAGHDVDSVRDEGLAGSVDDDVFRAAVAARRVLVTLDLDFSNPLRFPVGDSFGVVVIRAPRPVLKLIIETAAQALPRLATAQLAGKLWIVEPGRIREYAPEGEQHE